MRTRGHCPDPVHRTHRRPGGLALRLTPDDRRAGAKDLTTATVRGLHFGGPITEGEPAGNDLAAAEIIDWLSKRHELTPPA
jgi:hypothetical protein